MCQSDALIQDCEKVSMESCRVEGDFDLHFKLVSFNELIVLINGPRRLIFHLFRDIFEETGPTRGRPKLRDIVRCHLNTFIGRHDQAAAC